MQTNVRIPNFFMSEPISSHVERLTRPYIDGRRFTSSNDVLLFAMSLFGEFEQRYHDQLGESLRQAFQDIEHGEGIQLEGREEIDSFFQEMMEANRQQASRCQHGMIRLFISPAAAADLTAVGQYIGVEKGNVGAANRILEAIHDTLLLLPRFPQLGRSCPEFENHVPNLRSIVVDSYVVYYRLTDDAIEIARIVNARRDQEMIILRWVLERGEPD